MNIQRLKIGILENLYLGIGLIGSLFFVLVLLLPSISSLPGLTAQISDENSELLSLQGKSSLLNSLITNQASLKSTLDLLDRAIPSKDNVPTLMTEIQQISTDSGVTLKALQFGAGSLTSLNGGKKNAVADKNVKNVPLQAVADGTFSNLQAFLRNIEKASRIVTVDGLSFETKKNGEGVAATLSLNSYYLNAASVNALPVGFSLNDPDLKRTLNELKALKIYETEVTFSGVGKANPFE